jgi:alkanesulfonate monooxygenase SsuD/methylene tetrahydromethanopterin reductase-like flavin-dependent oxidoreductase (luciferase family)
MKVGLFVNTQFPAGDNVMARIPELVEQVRLARQCGFASLWFPHHYLTAPLQMLQMNTMMAYLLPEARGMTVGPNILILPLLNPVQVAEEAATLDVLSGGNYVLGVGLGYRAGEFEAFGVPLKERAPRLEESIALMRRLWTEDKVTHHGRFYSITDHGLSLKPARKTGVPIWMAAQVDAAIKRTARIGDAWLIVPATSIDVVEQQMRLYRDELQVAGRQADEFPILRECYIGANHKTAMEECRGPLEYKYEAYASWGVATARKPDFAEFARDRFIIGDAVFVKEEIARYRERLGVDHLMVRAHWPGLEQEKTLATIRGLGEICG